MKKEVILYPPNGESKGVIPHPSKIEEMKAKGWTEKSKPIIKKSKLEEKSNGKS